MANTTRSNVLMIAPQLATVSPDTIDLVIEDVAILVDGDLFGDLEERAQRYLAAHLITISSATTPGASGPIVEEEVGGERTKYATSGSNKNLAGCEETSYGREYLAMVKRNLAGMLTVTPDG